MTACHLWVDPDRDEDRCAWCLQPRSAHRFVPCVTCGGWRSTPDPADRSLGPLWARRRNPCGDCDTGWTVRVTGRPARAHELATVTNRKPAE